MLDVAMEWKGFLCLLQFLLCFVLMYFYVCISCPWQSSLCPLRSSNRHDLFLPHVRTTTAQTRAFSLESPPSSSSLLYSFSSAFFVFVSITLSHLKSYLFPGAEMH